MITRLILWLLCLGCVCENAVSQQQDLHCKIETTHRITWSDLFKFRHQRTNQNGDEIHCRIRGGEVDGLVLRNSRWQMGVSWKKPLANVYKKILISALENMSSQIETIESGFGLYFGCLRLAEKDGQMASSFEGDGTVLQASQWQSGMIYWKKLSTSVCKRLPSAIESLSAQLENFSFGLSMCVERWRVDEMGDRLVNLVLPKTADAIACSTLRCGVLNGIGCAMKTDDDSQSREAQLAAHEENVQKEIARELNNSAESAYLNHLRLRWVLVRTERVILKIRSGSHTGTTLRRMLIQAQEVFAKVDTSKLTAEDGRVYSSIQALTNVAMLELIGKSQTGVSPQTIPINCPIVSCEPAVIEVVQPCQPCFIECEPVWRSSCIESCGMRHRCRILRRILSR